jgi:hypothetical protein
MTQKIMLIRHAEKPVVPKTPAAAPAFGLLETGEPSEHGLTVKGWQRAGALAILFGPEGEHFRAPLLATPRLIFASALGPRSWSLRMQQTIQPLRGKLASTATVNLDYRKGEEDKMVAAALQSDGCVLICWSHVGIPAIAAAILGKANPAAFAWPDRRFDLVWVFDRQDGGGWSLTQIPQMLLAGDRPDVVALGSGKS